MIYFVGAGPGDPELISVKGARLLAEADCVIYAGSLVNAELLKYCKEGCEIYNSADLHLNEVIEIFKDFDKRGLNVVRLHTGDPALYGAIREQIDLLREAAIDFALCPGISSFSAAAAALECEYTLPEVSQSLIISRIAGRTPVPEKEALAKMAEHQTSMVLFLSAGHTKRVQEELLQGGYREDTPVAIVYKASWPEERVLRCQVSTLHETAEKAGIRNFALILVGDFLGDDYAKSKLYDPDFATAFRDVSTANKEKIYLLSFSQQSHLTAQKALDILTSLGHACDLKRCGSGQLNAWTLEHFAKAKALIYVGASGIAVRAIAPFVQAKTHDPAVLVIDEQGKYVIPLLSGHLGGANALARDLAEKLEAEAVITTATDRAGVFAIDDWTRSQGYYIANPEQIKHISSNLLAGKTLLVESDFPLESELPPGLKLAEEGEVTDIYLTWRRLEEKNPQALQIIVPSVQVGLGCKKGRERKIVEQVLAQACRNCDCHPLALAGFNSHELKKEEPGILELAESLNLPFRTYTAEELNEVEVRNLHHSDFVKSVTGTDNVSERSALRSGANTLLCPRFAEEGVTVALALEEIKIQFN